MRLIVILLVLALPACTSRPISTTTELDLSNQQLTVVPDSVFQMTNLEYLQLGNQFTLYPPMTAIAADSTSGNSMNKITAIPIDIAKLPNLRVLGIAFNNLQSLPKEFLELKKLDTLDLSFNEQLNISMEIETLKEMTWLKYLNLMATKADSNTIEILRKELPKTWIVVSFQDLEKKGYDGTK